MTATNGSAKSRDPSTKSRGLPPCHWPRGEADRRAGKPPGEKRQALLARASRLQASPANGPTKTNPGRWSGLLRFPWEGQGLGSWEGRNPRFGGRQEPSFQHSIQQAGLKPSFPSLLNHLRSRLRTIVTRFNCRSFDYLLKVTVRMTLFFFSSHSSPSVCKLANRFPPPTAFKLRRFDLSFTFFSSHRPV